MANLRVLGICLTLTISVIVGISLSSRGNSESTNLPEISEPSVTEVPVTERSEPVTEEVIPTEITDIKMEYRHEATDLSNSQIKYILYQGDKQLSYYKFLNGLENEKQLRDYFRSILNDVPFDTFKWETPSINANTITRPFEFIIGNVLDEFHLAGPQTLGAELQIHQWKPLKFSGLVV